jgi:hypothetical protein
LPNFRNIPQRDTRGKGNLLYVPGRKNPVVEDFRGSSFRMKAADNVPFPENLQNAEKGDF